jgi:hypothetical protein
MSGLSLAREERILIVYYVLYYVQVLRVKVFSLYLVLPGFSEVLGHPYLERFLTSLVTTHHTRVEIRREGELLTECLMESSQIILVQEFSSQRLTPCLQRREIICEIRSLYLIL